MKKQLVIGALALASVPLLDVAAMAATSVAWLTPPNNSHFLAGTTQNLTGQAAGQGQVGGTGLDLVLVMDSSGSMYGTGNGQIPQQNAAKALVAALPQTSTSVAIVDFDSSARTVIGLTQLDGTNAAINTAISSIDASGGTAIDAGISKATNDVLSSAAVTSSRLQAMVVMSDGGSSQYYADLAADTAISTSKVEAIHSVGMGNYVDQNVLKAVVNGADDVYGNADDYGKFILAANLDDLVGIFSGTTGNLVGLDHIDITLPDGTKLTDYATDGLGNFQLSWTLFAGANNFLAEAWGTDQSYASATWTLWGDTPNNAVPEPTTMLLLGAGLIGLAGMGRKKNA